jgi:hypothetical protein
VVDELILPDRQTDGKTWRAYHDYANANATSKFKPRVD